MSDNTLAIIQLVNTLAQLVQSAQLSFTDLAKAKDRATEEGRTFGQEDVDALIAKSRQSIADFERRLREYDDGDIS